MDIRSSDADLYTFNDIVELAQKVAHDKLGSTDPVVIAHLANSLSQIASGNAICSNLSDIEDRLTELYSK